MPPQCAIVPRDVYTAISGKAVHGLRKIFACEFFCFYITQEQVYAIQSFIFQIDISDFILSSFLCIRRILFCTSSFLCLMYTDSSYSSFLITIQ